MTHRQHPARLWTGKLKKEGSVTALGTLYTFGYGKLRGPNELRTLLEEGGVTGQVDVVLDIRFAPTGRNPLWRSGLVAETVKKGGIPEYLYCRALGNPDFKTGLPATRVFNEAEGMATLLNLLDDGKGVALMCVCADTAHCHRRLIVAKARAQRPGLRVVELEWGAPNKTS